jgi:pilus assembly protein CpaC
MRNHVKTACGTVIAGLAGLLASTLVPGEMSLALANGGNAKRNAAPYAAPPVFHSDHQSVLRVSEREGFPLHKGIKLGRNKSMLIEMPRELRDVIVSNPEIMDTVVQSSNRVYLIGKKVGQSNAFFFDSNGEQIAVFEVSIEHDTAVLDALFRRLIPGSNIKAEILNETIILTGSVRNPADSNRAADIASRFIVSTPPEQDARHRGKVINMLQVEAEEQVMLRVTVAEVERSVLKQFGINLGAELNIGNFATGILTANNFPLTTVAGLGGPMQAGSSTSAVMGQGCTLVAPQIQAGVIGHSGNYGYWSTSHACVAHGLKALERNGLIKTLAEPNLTAISGETAKFLAGGEFPIPVSVNSGQIGISFKEFGVGVSFTPIVLSEGRINLKIETEVSELSSAISVQLAGVAIQGLRKRQAKSTVELPSGGTLAMAGLISDDTRKNIDGFPGLKDVPVLGALFRSQDFIKRETELVVLVTPYTVRPTARQQFARPTDGLSPASDLKTNVLGHMNRIYGKNAPIAVEGGLKGGDIGFIVD